MRPPYTVVLIVPIGIGAAIGGYAGDALPVARALAQVADRLITHPNVLNGAQLYWPLSNAFYVEGYGLDQFAAHRCGLRPVHQNRIGLVLDQGIEPELRPRHLGARRIQSELIRLYNFSLSTATIHKVIKHAGVKLLKATRRIRKGRRRYQKDTPGERLHAASGWGNPLSVTRINLYLT